MAIENLKSWSYGREHAIKIARIGPEAEIEILTQFIGPVAKLDRYEARDLARRRTAMREFQALQAVKAKKPA